jgi:hypothetical protein
MRVKINALIRRYGVECRKIQRWERFPIYLNVMLDRCICQGSPEKENQ